MVSKLLNGFVNGFDWVRSSSRPLFSIEFGFVPLNILFFTRTTSPGLESGGHRPYESIPASIFRNVSNLLGDNFCHPVWLSILLSFYPFCLSGCLSGRFAPASGARLPSI